MIFHLFLLSITLFSIGMISLVIHKHNVIRMLMSFELMLLSAGVNFISFAAYYDDVTGWVIFLFMLAIAAAEVTVGLSIFLTYYRNAGNINTDYMNSLKG